MQAKDVDAVPRRVEAARYALLRRLTLAMRHQMVVHLQPIGMVSELMERRLRQPEPDLSQLGATMDKVQGFARAGVGASLDFVTWLAPEPGVEIALDAGSEESVRLLRSAFSFSGFALRSAVGDWPQPVSRSALRMLLPALLFGLADEAQAPADIAVSAQVDAQGRLLLQVRVRPGTGSPGFAAPASYRALAWDEVDQLARSEGLELTHTDGSATLRWPA
ncbi:MAG: hypothetical protein JWQ76_2383 [Ramlibacter sp.]|nr:hypothetical protein [Ramlibacter sp.]